MMMEKTGRKGLWNTALSRRALAAACVAWLLFMTLPLFALCFYAYPAYDDFGNLLPTAEAWAKTGSLWQTVKAAAQAAAGDYQSWQGTFVAMFHCHFQPMAFSLDAFWLTPFLTLSVWLLALAYLTHQVCRLLNARGRLVRLGLYTLMTTLMLAFMPGIREAVFWQAATQYILSFWFLLPMLGLLIRLHLTGLSRAGRVFAALLAALCAFCEGACPYPVALGVAVGLGAVTLWCFAAKSRARWASLICWLVLLAALLLVIIAPGNGVRQNRIGDSLNPALAIAYSVDAFLENSSGWLGPQWLAALALVPVLLWKPLKQSPFSFAHPFWVTVLGLGTAAAAFVPPIFAMGPDGYRYDRILASLYLLFALALFVVLIYLYGWLTRRVDGLPRVQPRVWHAAVCLGLVVWGLFGNAIFASPTIGAYKCLLTGEAAAYRRQMAERQEAMCLAETPEQVRESIQELSVAPLLFPNDMLIYQVESPVPMDMRRYFEVQRLIHTYGPGQIPQEEWQALDDWASGS